MTTGQLSKVIQHLRTILEKQDATGMTDADLLKRYVQQRDEAAFEVLVRRHGPMVLGVCRRVLHNLHDAEDAFQATFLVLVRKASTLRIPGMMGNWLYGVAYRTALHARAAAIKRRAKEAAVVAPTHPAEDTWTDLRPVLDRELQRLPDKYRAVVILCDLEGKTRREAARHLGWAEGTVASRLAKARAMLAKRLARHGVVLSSGTLAVMLAQDTASAFVPTSLLVSTVKAATLFAARQAAIAGAISAQVAALTEGVITTMFLTKVKAVVAVLLVGMALITSTVVMISQASSPDTQENKSQAIGRATQVEKTASPARKPKEADKVTASAVEIGNLYQTNMALADEKFTAKRVTVTGKMIRIRAVRQPQRVHSISTGQRIEPSISPSLYDLEMKLEGTDSKGTPLPVLRFHFTEDGRKQLAKLKAGQEVSVEGVLREAYEGKDTNIECIEFDDSRIVNKTD